ASAGCTPSAVSSRMACGRRLMPTPSGLISDAASNTRQRRPAACSVNASVCPPMPPPMMSTSTVPPVLSPTCSDWLLAAGDAGALHHGRPCVDLGSDEGLELLGGRSVERHHGRLRNPVLDLGLCQDFTHRAVDLGHDLVWRLARRNQRLPGRGV